MIPTITDRTLTIAAIVDALLAAGEADTAAAAANFESADDLVQDIWTADEAAAITAAAR